MAASIGTKFEEWLNTYLLSLSSDIDLEIFSSYITGVIETEDSSKEEKLESLEGILSQVVENDLDEHCNSILVAWEEKSKNNPEDVSADLDAKLASIMQQQKLSVATVREKGSHEPQHKDVILAQYAQLSDEEDDCVQHGKTTEMEPNRNAQLVTQEQKEKREKSKAEHEKKKLRDKEDKEKQKLKQQERKDAEKKRTQKGEKRR